MDEAHLCEILHPGRHAAQQIHQLKNGQLTFVLLETKDFGLWAGLRNCQNVLSMHAFLTRRKESSAPLVILSTTIIIVLPGTKHTCRD